MFHLFISSHPHIIMFLGSCALACFLALSHSHILIFMCTSLYPRILTSSYPQVHVPLLASLHPHILRFVCACLYHWILTFSYPQFHVCLLVSLHPHILGSLGLYVLASMFTSSGQCVLDTNEWLYFRIFKFIISW